MDALSMGFSRQEYWGGLPFSSPEHLPDPGIKPVFPVLPGGVFTTEPPGKPRLINSLYSKWRFQCSVLKVKKWPHGLYSPWNSPGQNTGVGSLSFSRGSSQLRSPDCRWILYQLSHKGSPRILERVAYPFSKWSSRLRSWTRVSCIAGGFFTNWTIR